MQRYAENNRLLNDFYATDPSEKEREELRSQVAELKNELAKKDDKEQNEEERQLALMEKSYQMAAKYLPKSTPNNPTALNNAFTQAQERTIVAPSSDKQSEGAKAVEVLPERKQVVSSLSGAMSDADFVKMYGTKSASLIVPEREDTTCFRSGSTSTAFVPSDCLSEEGATIVRSCAC